MPIHEVYSKRNKEYADIWVYDEIPDKLRIQIGYIITDFIDENNVSDYSNAFWDHIYKVLLREHGKPDLYISPGIYTGHGTSKSQILNYLKYEKSIDNFLDIIEVAFGIMPTFEKFVEHQNTFAQFPYSSLNAVQDLNYRFRENSFGYKFESGIIIKIDNELLHNTITKPTLGFLANVEFKAVNDEYLNAHEHFKNQKLQESINECLKAFESTIKIICHKKGWSFNANDTSKNLVKIIYDNNYIPGYLQTELSSLRSMLESGVPTIRNKTSSHGKGVSNISVNDELVSYTLNLTGSTIKFLLDLLDR